jgi:hypothetical protein
MGPSLKVSFGFAERISIISRWRSASRRDPVGKAQCSPETEIQTKTLRVAPRLAGPANRPQDPRRTQRVVGMFQDGLFRGKKILVTGGGTGLGRGMAERLLALGAEIAICGRRKGVCEAAAEEMMKAHGGVVESFGVDIRDAAAVDAMVEEIFREGPLTSVINNAAGNFIARTEDLSPRGFDAIANIVMHGTFYVTQAVGKRWIAGGHRGSVVSIAVTWVRNGGPFAAPSANARFLRTPAVR